MYQRQFWPSEIFMNKWLDINLCYKHLCKKKKRDLYVIVLLILFHWNCQACTLAIKKNVFVQYNTSEGLLYPCSPFSASVVRLLWM